MKQVKTYYDGSYACNTYVCSDDNYAIIIDPSFPKKNLSKDLTDKKVVGIFLTHAHYDHFIHLEDYLAYFNCHLFLSKKAYEKLNKPFATCSNYFGADKGLQIPINNVVFVNENIPLEIAPGFTVTTISTPGHTNCSVCYIIDDYLFSGDTLFKNGVGRTDLPTSNLFELTKSIKRLMDLKKNYLVFPGHDSQTTLDDEKHSNYFYLGLKK